jgi:hypothetical protein
MILKALIIVRNYFQKKYFALNFDALKIIRFNFEN